MIDFVDVPFLSVERLSALLSNQLAAIRVRNFLSDIESADILGHITAIGMENYVGDTKGGTAERKGKIGPNLFRFKSDVEEYFSRVNSFDADVKPVLFQTLDVPGRFKEAMRHGLPPGAGLYRAISASRGRELSECTVRSLPSAPPHIDWIRAEMPDFDAVSSLTDQFAWNVYISTGQTGGNTLIYDLEDPAKLDAGMTPVADLRPLRGDLILFRTRNVHEVTPTVGNRFTVSGFWGPRGDGHFQYWV